MESTIQNANIVPNIFSDHPAITLSMFLESNETTAALDSVNLIIYSLLMDKYYTEMITKQIPEFISKHCNLNDKGLFWEMIKIEIRAFSLKIKPNKNETKEKVCL